MNALKVHNQINPRTSNKILQDMSTQIPNLTEAARGFRRNVPNAESGGLLHPRQSWMKSRWEVHILIVIIYLLAVIHRNSGKLICEIASYEDY